MTESSGRFARISERAIRCRELAATDWRVLACISLHADTSGRAYPGMTIIATMTGVRRQDVPRTIRRLERFRLLRYEPSGGPNGANIYTLLFEDEGVSAGLRTVRNGTDSGCPQDCGQGVRNGATKVSATLQTKQTIEQTNEQIRADADGADAWFERFWRIYPDRGDHTKPKKPAQVKFLTAIKGGADPEAIIRGADNYRRARDRYRGDERRFVKQPANWLGQRCWEQYEHPAAAPPKFGGML
jgi:hypothetical protein